MAKEITAQDLQPGAFIADKVAGIRAAVGDGTAINALSGGVDSSTVTLLGHRALGERLRTVFIENGIMRAGEPERVVALFADLGVKVEVVDARDAFFAALKGLTDPEEKREAITQTFYKDVFGRLVRESGAKHLLQGTILTDIDETVAGIKRQHNVFEQLGIDPGFLKENDLHIHVPAGAIPKDGPSAGVTLTTALVSLLTHRSVRPDVAMTGEVTLRGLVLPVGGIKEKVLAAHRAGIKTILLPARNESDLREVPDKAKSELTFHLLERVDQAFEYALCPDDKGIAAPPKKAAGKKKPAKAASKAGRKTKAKAKKTAAGSQEAEERKAAKG